MNVIIAGGGKVGYYLVRALVEKNHYPTVIEVDPDVCKVIANEMDIPVILGDVTRYETLIAANASEMDAFISVTGSDESNLIACQLAKNEFGISKTVAKSNDPRNAELMQVLGIDNVINSTDSIVSLIEREVDTSKIKQLLQINNGIVTLFEVDLPNDYKLNGKMIMDIKSSSLFNIVSITRNGSLIIPRGQTILRSNDKLLIISETDTVDDIKAVLKIKEK